MVLKRSVSEKCQRSMQLCGPACSRIQLEQPGNTAVIQNPNEQVKERRPCFFSPYSKEIEIAFQPPYMRLFKVYPILPRFQVGWQGKPSFPKGWACLECPDTGGG